MASFDSGDIAQLAYIINTAAVTVFTAYTVPVGKKALILEIRSNNATSTTHIILFNQGASTDVIIAGGGANAISFQGKVVLAAGEFVQISKASSNSVRTIVVGIEVDA